MPGHDSVPRVSGGTAEPASGPAGFFDWLRRCAVAYGSWLVSSVDGECRAPGCKAPAVFYPAEVYGSPPRVVVYPVCPTHRQAAEEGSCAGDCGPGDSLPQTITRADRDELLQSLVMHTLAGYRVGFGHRGDWAAMDVAEVADLSSPAGLIEFVDHAAEDAARACGAGRARDDLDYA